MPVPTPEETQGETPKTAEEEPKKEETQPTEDPMAGVPTDIW